MAIAALRLKKRAEFLRVAAKGKKAPMPGLVLQALRRDDTDPARLGFTVTKKVGNAVVRNRTRRRLKEAARLLLTEQPVTGFDLVLIGRDGTRKRNFRQLQQDIQRAFDRTGVIPVAPISDCYARRVGVAAARENNKTPTGRPTCDESKVRPVGVP